MSRARIPSLDGVRAISIVLVIAGHWTETHSGGTKADIAGAFANLGVRIFFVLSGYLITRLLLEKQAGTETIGLRQFYARRTRRIFPAALFFMLTVFVLYRRELRWQHALAALFYVTNFDPGHPWFLGHLWSLSVEEQFYLLWPAVLEKWRPYRRAILAFVIVQAPIYRVACHLAGWHGQADETFPAVADILAVGCLTAVLSSPFSVPSRTLVIPNALLKPFVIPNAREARVRNLLLEAAGNAWLAWAMLAIVIAVPVYTGILHFHLTALLLFVAWPLLHVSIAGLLLHVIQRPYAWLNLRPVAWLGTMSYSLYLWQQLFAFGPHPRPAARLTWAVVIACVSYYGVERPMLRIKFSSANGSEAAASTSTEEVLPLAAHRIQGNATAWQNRESNGRQWNLRRRG
jgi:peptidoglycan/LPS O-acetylase OafA/YrhL